MTGHRRSGRVPALLGAVLVAGAGFAAGAASGQRPVAAPAALAPAAETVTLAIDGMT